MEDIKRLRNDFEVQSDILSLDMDQFLNKYTTSIFGYSSFLDGTYNVFNRCHAPYLLEFDDRKIFSALTIGYHNIMKNIVAYGDASAEKMQDEYDYINAMVQLYDNGMKDHPGLMKKLNDQHECIQSGYIGVPNSEFKDFLIDLPRQFDRLTYGVRIIDPNRLSTIAYLTKNYPDFIMDEENKSLIGDLSRRTIRRESLLISDPVRYRKAGNCARRLIERKEKELKKAKVKSI